MKRRELQALQRMPDKRLEGCQFGPCRKGKLPKPLEKLGGERFKVTPLYEVNPTLRAVFIWKTAEVREQRALYGWLFQETPRGLVPLIRQDYHPSHKNLHLVLNCERDLDLTNRGLPGCRELALHEVDWDPDEASDRQQFVKIFCERLKIDLEQPWLL
jgi:hypothetical protein